MVTNVDGQDNRKQKSMDIAFFEAEDWEKKYLKNKLKNHNLTFVSDFQHLESLNVLKDVEILSPFIYSTIDQSVLQHLPSLKLIATRSTGYDHIDIKECQRRNIIVSNVPSYGENTVAEHTFSLILSLSRNLYKACIERLTNDYSIKKLRGFDLKGKTLGVVGTGRIGLYVIRIAKGFGMNVVAFDVKPNTLMTEILGFNYMPLEKLLEESHIVSLHVPYNEHTHHLIDADKLKLMRPDSFLINTARGAVVDTEALVSALRNRTIAGAGLDVLEGEEFIQEERAVFCECNKAEVLSTIGRNDLLLHMQNVVYTPHIGFNSQEALERIIETTVHNIEFFLKGNPDNVVSHNATAIQEVRA